MSLKSTVFDVSGFLVVFLKLFFVHSLVAQLLFLLDTPVFVVENRTVFPVSTGMFHFHDYWRDGSA